MRSFLFYYYNMPIAEISMMRKWPTLKYTKSQVKSAGKILRDDSSSALDRQKALAILGNWRSCHNYPINTFQSTLRKKLQNIDNSAIVAQRLKRAASIIKKLKNNPKNQLTTMQDIGGLRSIMGSLGTLYELLNSYRYSNRLAHELVDVKDYVLLPKPSGYRSIHIIYKYRNAKNSAYDGLRIELQLRTVPQHAWATAVETVEMFVGSALKSSEGPSEWLEFFKYAGSSIALLEGIYPTYEHENMSQNEIFSMTKHLATKLKVLDHLQTYTLATSVIGDKVHPSGSYHLLLLDANKLMIRGQSFSRDQLEEANAEYSILEQKVADSPHKNAVLVATSSINSLRQAYPNYFLDTHKFVSLLKEIGIE